jgi:hypothetical protein
MLHNVLLGVSPVKCYSAMLCCGLMTSRPDIIANNEAAVDPNEVQMNPLWESCRNVGCFTRNRNVRAVAKLCGVGHISSFSMAASASRLLQVYHFPAA